MCHSNIIISHHRAEIIPIPIPHPNIPITYYCLPHIPWINVILTWQPNVNIGTTLWAELTFLTTGLQPNMWIICKLSDASVVAYEYNNFQQACECFFLLISSARVHAWHVVAYEYTIPSKHVNGFVYSYLAQVHSRCSGVAYEYNVWPQQACEWFSCTSTWQIQCSGVWIQCLAL